MLDHSLAHLALRARLLTASGLPTKLVLENERYTPTTGTPYLTEDYVPAEGVVKTFPASTGTIEATGLYVVHWYGVAGVGNAAIRTGVAAILGKLSAGWTQVLSNGDQLRIRSDVIPMPQQILPLDDGFVVCTVKVPFRIISTNAIVA